MQTSTIRTCKSWILSQNENFRQRNYTRNSKNGKGHGIIIDKNLNFQEHIHIQISKTNRILGLIRRTFHHMDKYMFLNLYKSLIKPHLEYGSNVWKNLCKSLFLYYYQLLPRILLLILFHLQSTTLCALAEALPSD